MASNSKSLRVQAGAIPATDVSGYWLPVIVTIDPEIRSSPIGNAVIPELCTRMDWALSRAERVFPESTRHGRNGAMDGGSRPTAILCCPTTPAPLGATSLTPQPKRPQPPPARFQKPAVSPESEAGGLATGAKTTSTQ